MIRSLWILGGLILAACTATAPSDPTTSAAESEARQVVVREFPGVDVDGLAKCVRANADEDQLAALSLGGMLAQEATAAILSKPETAECVRDNDIRLPS
jgi:hypothetical protein